MRKVLNPNNVTAAAQAAALATLQDQAYMRETCEMTASLRDGFKDRLREAEFAVAESYTNFVLIDLGTPDKAASADAALRREGVFLRPQHAVGLSACLRATIGQPEDLNLAAEMLEHCSKEWRP